MEASNLLVAQAIASSVKSLLGPHNSVKCCVSGEGCSVICSGAAKLLECIDVQHPAGYVINDACQCLFKTLGSGCKTFLCLCGFWSNASQLLWQQGIPIPAIVKHFREALSECDELLNELAVPLTSLNVCDVQAGGTGPTVTSDTNPRVSRSSSVSSSKGDDGNSTVPKREESVVHSFGDKMSLYQRTARTPEFSNAYTSTFRGRSADRGATQTSIQQRRMIKGSRHFAADLNLTPHSLISEGNLSGTPNERGHSSTQFVTSEPGHWDARRNVKCTLDRLGERICHGKENEMKLAVQAVYSQFVNSHKRSLSQFQVHKKMIHVEIVVGPPVHFSQVVDGLVLECRTSSEELYKVLAADSRELFVVLVNNDVTPQCIHVGSRQTAMINQILQGNDVSKESVVDKDLWLRRVIRVLQVHNISVLVSKGFVAESLVDYCISSKIILIQNVSSSKLQVLCSATGATLVSYLKHVRWSDVGKVANIRPWELSWTPAGLMNSTERSHYVVMVGRAPHVQTSVLCGTCRDIVYDTELKFWNCFSRLKNALACGRTLPGAGVSEIACIDRLQQSADQAGGGDFKSLVYGAFSRGLQDFLVSTLHNSGRFFSPLHTLNHVLCSGKSSKTNAEWNRVAEAVKESIHEEKPESLLDDNNRTPAGCVLDDYLAKKEAWRRALDMVCTLLQTDMYIVTGAGH